MSYKIMGCRIILFCVFYAYYNYKEKLSRLKVHKRDLYFGAGCLVTVLYFEEVAFF